jgi:hypothetical protein
VSAPLPLPHRLARYRAWLRREPTDGPLVGILWEPDIPPLPDVVTSLGAGTSLQPEQIIPQHFLPYVEQCYRQAAELPGDLIQAFTPAFGMPWVEAIAGCPVAVEPGSLWAQPALPSYTDRAPIRFDPGNPWLHKLIEFTQALVAFSAGRFPIALPQMRGPLDILAALRTPQQMSIDLIEQPDQVGKLLVELTALWIGVAGAVLAEIPPFHGGYCSRMRMWTPGLAITPQNDISTLLSPRMYRRLVLPLDEQIVAAFPFHCFHMHGSESHQVDNLLALERLTAIQFTLEHTLGGPSLEQTLPVLRRILAHKPLIVAALDVASAERCLTELPAAGLCLTVAVSGAEIPAKFVAWVSEHQGRCMAARDIP